MTDRQIKNLKVENLIYRLNALADQRKSLFDQLWQTENVAQELRIELLQLLDGSYELKKPQ